METIGAKLVSCSQGEVKSKSRIGLTPYYLASSVSAEILVWKGVLAVLVFLNWRMDNLIITIAAIAVAITIDLDQILLSKV